MPATDLSPQLPVTDACGLEPAMPVSSLSDEARIELAYLARKERLVHPDGTFDKQQRWYPDRASEGGVPQVRTPSAAWPYSYMVACRTRVWCARLPAPTRDRDAAVALRTIAAGRLQPSPRLLKLMAKAGR